MSATVCSATLLPSLLYIAVPLMTLELNQHYLPTQWNELHYPFTTLISTIHDAEKRGRAIYIPCTLSRTCSQAVHIYYPANVQWRKINDHSILALGLDGRMKPISSTIRLSYLLRH